MFFSCYITAKLRKLSPLSGLGIKFMLASHNTLISFHGSFSVTQECLPYMTTTLSPADPILLGEEAPRKCFLNVDLKGWNAPQTSEIIYQQIHHFLMPFGGAENTYFLLMRKYGIFCCRGFLVCQFGEFRFLQEKKIEFFPCTPIQLW